VRYYVVFVDAEYLSVTMAGGRSKERPGVDIDMVVEWFASLPTSSADPAGRDLVLLRTYWYDAVPRASDGPLEDRPDPASIRSVPNVVFRTGLAVRSGRGPYRQKAVDARLTLDMVQLAERGVYDTAVLVAGDGDLVPAVEAVQDTGRRVVLVVLDSPHARLASELRNAVDRFLLLDGATLNGFLAAGNPHPRASWNTPDEQLVKRYNNLGHDRQPPRWPPVGQ
jgi:hypothetical protein